MPRLLTVIAGICAVVGLPALAQELTYPCFRAQVAPVIDGVVRDDPGWANVPGATGFYALGGGYTVAKQSVARACWDDRFLYLAMVCEEPDIALIKPALRDGDGLWAENSVELFLEPQRNGPIYQIVVNTAGAKTLGPDVPDLPGLKAAAAPGEAEYSVEVALPLAELRGDWQQPGWHVAFCRNIWVYKSGGDKFTCWPALRSQFREPANFALLQVRNETATPESCAAAEGVLNGAYRRHLVAQVQALVPEADDYLEVLREAARDQASPLQREARSTVLTWARVLRLGRTAEQAPTPELRQTAAIARELRERSHRLKYAYLIETLLRE